MPLPPIPPSAPVPQYRQSNNLATLGDSITAHWYGGSVADSGIYTQPFGYLKWALELSNQRYNVVVSAATPSTGCTSYSASFTPTFQQQLVTVLASTATRCLVFGAINDIQSGAPLSLIQANMLPIVQTLVQAGMRVDLCTITPMNSTYANYSVSTQGTMLAYNAWIRSLCSKYAHEGVRLIDLYKTAVGHADTTSSYQTGYSYDGLHPINVCAFYMGQELARVWTADGDWELPMLISCAGDAQVSSTGAALFPLSTNVLQNGLFNTGAITAGVAANWSVTNGGTGTSTPSVVAAAIGNAQQLACTFAAVGDTVTLTSANFKNLIPVGANAGNLIATAAITVTSPVNLLNVQMQLLGYGNVNPEFTWSLTAPNDAALPVGWSGVMRADLDMAAWGVTSLGGGMTLSFQVQAAGAGSATVAISQVSVRTV